VKRLELIWLDRLLTGRFWVAQHFSAAIELATHSAALAAAAPLS